VVGVLSLVVLAVACWALYGRRLAGAWRAWYVVTALLALYLNVFVAVVQAFQKVPAVRRLAPTQSEGPFLVAQLAVLALFAVLAVRALRRFRPVPAG
jgi:K+-transporting ATPase A subunit